MRKKQYFIFHINKKNIYEETICKRIVQKEKLYTIRKSIFNEMVTDLSSIQENHFGLLVISQLHLIVSKMTNNRNLEFQNTNVIP